MYRLLILLFTVLISMASCKKLSGENDYQLAEGCEDFKTDIEQNIIKVNVDKGIHYVAVDTANCSLKVRYEADKVDLTWLYEQLDTLGYLAIVADSLVTPADSALNDSLVVNKEVNEYTESHK